MRRLAVVALLAVGCGRQFASPAAPQELSVSPGSGTLAPAGRLELTIAGGRPGYSAHFAQPTDATVSIEDATAHYVAGVAGDRTDELQIVDAEGRAAPPVFIRVGPKLRISPAVASVAAGGTLGFEASGGQPPYQFALQSPATGAATDSTLDGATLHAGAQVGEVELVVTDANGQSDRATASVGAGVTIFPKSAQVRPGERLQLQAIGGRPPYAWSLASTDGGSPAGATLGATGELALASDAPAGKLQVVVTDGLTSDSAAVEVLPGLSANVNLQADGTPLQLSPGEVHAFSASGGAPPYSFGFAPWGNLSGGTLTADGTYRAGPNPDEVDTVRIRDTLGVETDFQVAVGPIALPRGGASGLPSPFGVRRGMTFVGNSGLHFTGDGYLELLPNTPVFVRDVGDFNGDGNLDVLSETVSLSGNVLAWGTGPGALSPSLDVGPHPAGLVVLEGQDAQGNALPRQVLASDPRCASGLSTGSFSALLVDQLSCSDPSAGNSLVLGPSGAGGTETGLVVDLGSSGTRQLAAVLQSDEGSSLTLAIYGYGNDPVEGDATLDAPLQVGTIADRFQLGSLSPVVFVQGPRVMPVVLEQGPALALISDASGQPKLYVAIPQPGGLQILSADVAPPYLPGALVLTPGPGHDLMAVSDLQLQRFRVVSSGGTLQLELLADVTPFGSERIAAVGDLDGDGSVDVLFSQDNGLVFAGGAGNGLVAEHVFQKLADEHFQGSRFQASDHGTLLDLHSGDLWGDGGADLLVVDDTAVRGFRGVARDAGGPGLALGGSSPRGNLVCAYGVARLGPGLGRILAEDTSLELVALPAPGSGGAPLPLSALDSFGCGSPIAVVSGLGPGDADRVAVMVTGQDRTADLYVDLIGVDGSGQVTSHEALDWSGGAGLAFDSFGIFDFDADGVPDLVAIGSTGQLYVATGSVAGGDLDFATPQRVFPASAMPFAAVTVLDPRGHRLLQAASTSATTLMVGQITASGATATQVTLPTNAAGTTPCAYPISRLTWGADVDGDGQTELAMVVSSQLCGTSDPDLELIDVAIDGQGAPGAIAVSKVGEAEFASAVLRDFDGDGRDDLVIQPLSDTSQVPLAAVHVFAGQADGTVAASDARHPIPDGQ